MDLSLIQSQMLDILLEFDRICRKYHLKYTLAWGTMLGAVRHGGFIPWDADADILMLREDYEAFCSICEKELDSRFFLQTKHTEPAYRYNVARLRKNNTALIYRTWKNAGFHQGIYVDVQPLDHLPDSRIRRLIQSFFIILNTPVRISMNRTLFRETAQQYPAALKAVLYVFCRIMPKKLCERIETHFILKYNKIPCKRLAVLCEGGVLLHPTRDMLPFDASYMDDIVPISFAGHEFLCSAHTDELLTLWYGDYMMPPPEEQRKPDHEPLVLDAEKSYEFYLSEGNL